MRFGIDANFICNFQRERILGVADEWVPVVDKFLNIGQLIMDVGKKCEQEWLDCGAGPIALNLADWLADLFAAGKALPIDVRPVGNDRNRLIQLGFPKKDHKWFALCRDGQGVVFLTDDIDFFDPRLKAANENAKCRARNNRNAPVRRHFRRELGCEVLSCVEAVDWVV